MHKFASYFSVIFLLLALVMLFGILYFNMPLLLSGSKIVLFALINSLILVAVGIFFVVFKERIILYFENYTFTKNIISFI